MAKDERDEIYDKKFMKRLEQNLEEYLKLVTRFIILQGCSISQYENSIKEVKKLIKYLKKGKGHKVFNRERYLAELEAGTLDV